jgi:hypothetical protein
MSDSNDDEEFVTAFRDIIAEEWSTVQEVDLLYVSVSKYSMCVAQMSRIMSPYIQYMHKKFQVLLLKESVQVLSYQDRPRAATAYNDFKVSWTPCLFTNCSGDSKKCRSRLLKHAEARFPGQTIQSVFVVFLDIRSTSVAKTIIDTEIYEKDFDHFVARVLDV